MSGHLGYARVPESERGWDGNWGDVPIQGPPPAPKGYVLPPQPDEIASAMVTTEWTCPFCEAENDVWGEGAIYSWMACAECGREAFLEMDVPQPRST